MARSQFETLANFLKAHPATRPVNTHRRGPNANDDRKPSPDPDRHRRKCAICRHPHRHEIEADFLRWRSLTEIANSFGIADRTSIWRHACATSLRDQRQRRIAYALHPILEQSEDIFLKPTPSAIISAVRTYSQINDEGRKLRSKPIERIYYVSEPAARRGPTNDACPPGRESPACPERSRRVTSHRVSGFHESRVTSHKSQLPNRNIQELEGDPTH